MGIDGKYKKISIVFILILTLVVSGCTGGTDQPEENGGPSELEITEYSFATNIEGKDSYEEHSDQYGPNDNIEIYFEAQEFKKEDGVADIKQDLVVLDPDGNKIMEKTIVNEELDLGNKDEIWFTNKITPPKDGFDNGVHEVKIILEDKSSDKDLTYTETFKVKGADESSDSQEQAKELEMTEFSFASSITGKNDYVEHSDQFNPKNMVYLYFEAKGFEKQDGKVSLKQDLKVTGPDGEVLHDKTIVDDILNAGDQEEIWFNNHFTHPDGAFKLGEHTVKLEITDKRTGNTLEYTETFTVEEIEGSGEDEEMGLEIREFSFAESISGAKDYVSQSNEYATNETVKIYFEIWGLTVENDKVEFKQSKMVIDPDGEVLEENVVADTEISDMSEADYIWGKNYIEPPENGFEVGTYTVQLEVLDKVEQSTTEITKEYIIVEES